MLVLVCAWGQAILSYGLGDIAHLSIVDTGMVDTGIVDPLNLEPSRAFPTSQPGFHLW